MKKFSNYDKVEVNEFKQTEKLNVGGHYCKILDVNIEKLNNGSEQLSFKIDIDSPDEQAGFYSRKFKEDADKDPMTAKWKGYYKMFLPNDDGSENDEKTKSNFKGVITSIEKSNPGYDWEKADWDEKTLIGKRFVGVFGAEEFELPTTGDLIYFVRCRFVRSTEEELDKIPIPKTKLKDKSYMDYEEWLENWDARKSGFTVNTNVNTTSDDDLPF